jgi:hypothetical protein
MKNNNRIIAIVILTCGVLLSSCKKTFFSNANTNPNAPSPSSILPATLLSTVEGSLAYTQGGDLSRFTQYFTQQTLGAYNQSSAYYTYVITSQDVDQLWGNLYTSVMENADTLVGLSDAKKFYAYSGIGRILKAYALQITVDAWGSVPYSGAFKGAEEFSAEYDVDNELYNTAIISLLTDGIYYLKNTSSGQSGPNTKPGSDDIIYGGSLDNWIKFAHAIKARIYLHQSKGSSSMAASSLTEIDSAFSSNSDIAQFVFGDAPTANNPVFQFNDQRAYTDYPSGTLAQTMVALNDPRYPMFFDSTYSDYDGVGIGTYYGNTTSPVEFISYDELLFAKAEAILRSGGTIANAQIAYNSAISNNMLKLGVSPSKISTYLTANGTLPASTASAIAQIALQANIALYLNPEAWTTWRRTGSPALTPVSGNQIPRRLLYPLSELNYNTNTPKGSTLFSPKIFWDN